MYGFMKLHGTRLTSCNIWAQSTQQMFYYYADRVFFEYPRLIRYKNGLPNRLKYRHKHLILPVKTKKAWIRIQAFFIYW